MPKILSLLALLILLQACNSQKKNFDTLLDNYWTEYNSLHPLEATAVGISDYNDRLPIDISDTFRSTLYTFIKKYQDALLDLNPDNLSATQQISYEILSRELLYKKEYLDLPNQYLPINQFDALPLSFAQLGSGQGNQPFENEQDYQNFLKRINSFHRWTEAAIDRMKEGIEKGIVLPRPLVQKMIGQYRELISAETDSSIFYQPCHQFPEGIKTTSQDTLSSLYRQAIDQHINPAYQGLVDFLTSTYLPAARSTDGYDALPEGDRWYNYWVRKWTTTNLSPEEIYNIGIDEVAHLRAEMEGVMKKVNYSGTLKSFFEYCNTDAQFMPFSTAQEVIDSYQHIYDIERPHLADLFDQTPKTQFEIRQTEKFREATASAEYMPASEDGSRPGIFYCPIPHPTKFNAIGMETLFLHEAIPGHHYQVSLQQENKELPSFRRFLWYGAYGEGWALYTESLGPELGLMSNPYQYFGHLSDAMLRAVRLVVDVGLHTGKMTRDEAIAYMLDNMRTTPAEATQEIERYMAIPGQALSYMIGKKKILQLRNQTKDRLGDKFDIKKFHKVVLAHGCLPLETLEKIVSKI